MCDNYQITQLPDALDEFNVDVLETGIFTIPSFTNEAELRCPSDCTQAFELTIDPNDIVVNYDRDTNELTISSDDEL